MSGGTGGVGAGAGGTGGVGGMPAGGSAGTMDSPMMAGTGGTGGIAASRAAGPGGMMDPPLVDEPPFGGADVFTWNTDEFTLEAGEEAYLCFASNLEEDLVINGYNSDVQRRSRAKRAS